MEVNPKRKSIVLTNYMYEIAKKSANFGFEGATCIHPTMVNALNRGFSPTQKEVSDATLVVEVMKKAWKNNKNLELNGLTRPEPGR